MKKYLSVRKKDNLINGIIKSYLKPNDTENLFYVEYDNYFVLDFFTKKYYIDGEIIEERIPGTEKLIYERAIQSTLDRKAQEYGYDNIISACSYAGYDNPYQEESKKFIKWRGSVWHTAYQILQDVESGNREPPSSVQELLDELPKFEDTTL